MTIGGQRDHQDIGLGSGRFEVAEMTHMQEIENPMRESDGLFPLAQASRDLGDLVDRLDLVAGALARPVERWQIVS